VHSPSPTPTPSCTADGVNFDVTSADGYVRHAAVYGSGPVVVIAHQSDETRCDVVPVARWLRDNHYAAVVVDLRGDWTGVLAGTIATMRARGATSVQLLGASMGGNVAMIVGGQVTPPVASVVSLGGERSLGPGYDADAAVAHSHVPLFIVTSINDGYLLEGEARALIAESAATDKRSLILPGSLHGTAMLDGPDGAQVKAAILMWLAAHAT
jgi:esterase/lipase